MHITLLFWDYLPNLVHLLTLFQLVFFFHLAPEFLLILKAKLFEKFLICFKVEKVNSQTNKDAYPFSLWVNGLVDFHTLNIRLRGYMISLYIDYSFVLFSLSVGFFITIFSCVSNFIFANDDILFLHQKLVEDAERCRRRMVAASSLINGLSGEKIRWTEQSHEFKAQVGRQAKFLCFSLTSYIHHSYHILHSYHICTVTTFSYSDTQTLPIVCLSSLLGNS